MKIKAYLSSGRFKLLVANCIVDIMIIIVINEAFFEIIDKIESEVMGIHQ